MPARAPASIDMLQTVSRPSIDMSRNTWPAYSSTLPVPPAAPMRATIARITSLANTPWFSLPSTLIHGAGFSRLPNSLRSEHMRDLGGADAEGERPECPVARGVAVAAHHHDPRQADALLGADDVDYALARIAEPEMGEAVCGRVLGK